MASIYKTPGVYREEIFLKPEAQLPTGVPGFVGFADAGSQGGPEFNTPVALHRKEDFAATFSSRPESFLGETVTGFFDNGGTRCYVVRADPDGDRIAALQNALGALAPLNDLDLVAAPDAMTLLLSNGKLDVPAIVQVQQQTLGHCAELGNRLAILDALPQRTTDGILDQRHKLTVGQAEPVNGALYYPWIKTVGERGERLAPPCGHVAGIFARTDARVGVFKAPANEEIFGVFDLGVRVPKPDDPDQEIDGEIEIDNSIQDQLNPEGVNCLRAFRGRGIRVWGARTLSSDPNWRYVNVRRLFLTLNRGIDMNMAFATFEPNEPRLWARIQRELTTYLTKLARDGALKGATPDQAFFVKCNAETNPPELREVGQVVTEIGLAPLSPAEFIVVRIIHRASATDSLQ
jgi:phage tail sheath protein FI